MLVIIVIAMLSRSIEVTLNFICLQKRTTSTVAPDNVANHAVFNPNIPEHGNISASDDDGRYSTFEVPSKYNLRQPLCNPAFAICRSVQPNPHPITDPIILAVLHDHGIDMFSKLDAFFSQIKFYHTATYLSLNWLTQTSIQLLFFQLRPV